jgi:hypothetical protein
MQLTDPQESAALTSQMVMKLPDDGKRFHVFVQTNQQARHLRDVINDLRGFAIARQADIIIASEVDRALHLMRGRPVDRVFIDHAAGAALKAFDSYSVGRPSVD